MTITTRYRAAARRRRSGARAILAPRPGMPTSRYSAPLDALTELRRR